MPGAVRPWCCPARGPYGCCSASAGRPCPRRAAPLRSRRGVAGLATGRPRGDPVRCAQERLRSQARAAEALVACLRGPLGLLRLRLRDLFGGDLVKDRVMGHRGVARQHGETGRETASIGGHVQHEAAVVVRTAVGRCGRVSAAGQRQADDLLAGDGSQADRLRPTVRNPRGRRASVGRGVPAGREAELLAVSAAEQEASSAAAATVASAIRGSAVRVGMGAGYAPMRPRVTSPGLPDRRG